MEEQVMPVGDVQLNLSDAIKNALMIVGIICVLGFAWTHLGETVEFYRNCRTCDDDYRMIDGGVVVSNPFVWPYSAVEDVEKLYYDNKKAGSKSIFGFKNEPLIHLNTPDHVMLT